MQSIQSNDGVLTYPRIPIFLALLTCIPSACAVVRVITCVKTHVTHTVNPFFREQRANHLLHTRKLINANANKHVHVQVMGKPPVLLIAKVKGYSW
jgi:hypothetical protein